MRRPVVLGALAGFAAGLTVSACGGTLPAPTSLFVSVSLTPDSGTQTLLFRFADRANADVVPPAYRSDEAVGGPLSSPQTVRVYVPSSAAGASLTTVVQGLDERGHVVEQGEAKVTPVLNASVDVAVVLALVDDGGTRLDAGLAFDAGVVALDGGCPCNGGCCDGTGACQSATALTLPPPAPQGLTAFRVPCGAANGVCTGVCDLGSADRCLNGACACGTGPACGRGTRCLVRNGVGQCVCDEASGCDGCCSSLSTCARGQTAASCGGAGLLCEKCDVGVCTAHTCVAKCVAQKGTCCSGPSAMNTKFPTCKSAFGNCEGCDVARSDRCTADGFCGCGDELQCGASKLCVSTPTGFGCR